MEAPLHFFAYSPIIGLTGFVFAIATYYWVLKQPAGHEKMTHISGLIESGSMTFLKKEYSILIICLLYTSPSPRDRQKSRMPSSA